MRRYMIRNTLSIRSKTTISHKPLEKYKKQRTKFIYKVIRYENNIYIKCHKQAKQINLHYGLICLKPRSFIFLEIENIIIMDNERAQKSLINVVWEYQISALSLPSILILASFRRHVTPGLKAKIRCSIDLVVTQTRIMVNLQALDVVINLLYKVAIQHAYNC